MQKENKKSEEEKEVDYFRKKFFKEENEKARICKFKLQTR